MKIEQQNETLKEKTKETMTEETEKKDETVLEMFASSDSQVAYLDESKLPKWLFKYLVFRFILLDRTGTKNSRLVCCYLRMQWIRSKVFRWSHLLHFFFN